MGIFGKKQQDTNTENADQAPNLNMPFDSNVRLNQLRKFLISPRVSEKSSRLLKQNQYVFVVGKKANKVEVKKAVEAFYKVKVLRVNMISVQGKDKMFGRTPGRTSDFKKAIVTLKQGDSIKGLTDVA